MAILLQNSALPLLSIPMEAEHPKVRLDSVAEYRFIYSKIEEVARQKLATYFPNATTSDSSIEANVKEDAYRKRVEQLVNEVRFLFVTA